MKTNSTRSHRSSPWRPGRACAVAFGVLAVASAASPVGCASADSPSPSSASPDLAVGTTSEAYSVAGQNFTVANLGAMDPTTQNIASCGEGWLYAVRSSGTTRTTWFKSTFDDTSPWQQSTTSVAGDKIACDHHQVYSVDAQNRLYRYTSAPNGQLTSSTLVGNTLPAGTTDIQSGHGNLYAIAYNAGGSSLYVSPQNDGRHTAPQGSSGTWQLLASNLGSSRVSGTGSATLTTPAPNVSSPPHSRVFGMNPDSTLYYNDTMLTGQNWWTGFSNGGIPLLRITADSTNALYGMAITSNWTLNLYKYTFTEANCSDGVDNDANGLTDATDPACKQTLANTWCATNVGNFCYQRIASSFKDALVTCPGSGQAAVIKPGLCTMGFWQSDYQLSTPNGVPANTGYYCNTIAPDGTWGFSASSGVTPCFTLTSAKPGSKIVRAGMYSTTGNNDVLARCTDGGIVTTSAGTVGVNQAVNLLGKTANRCVITVSPRSMPVFGSPFPNTAWQPGASNRGYAVGHYFDHAPDAADAASSPCGAVTCPISLSQFGNGATGTSTHITNLGKDDGWYDNQGAYDFILDEGTPLLALGYGKVLPGGSRGRDVTWVTDFGSPRQNEIVIQYDVGTDPTYRESFVAYYAHASDRLVESGQTVAPGQIIGYVGQTGHASGPHVHFGLTRITNVNVGQPGSGIEEQGYHVPFVVDPTDPSYDFYWGMVKTGGVGLVDPYGWRAPAGIDPSGYYWSRASTGLGSPAWVGMGAWSPAVWTSGQVPPFNP